MKQRLDDHAKLTPWMIRVIPSPGESFGHFIARFRRANCLSVGSLASMLGQRPYIISYWETPSRRRRPNRQQLRSLAELMGIEVKILRSTLLPVQTQVYLQTRLCPLCYSEVPIHQALWQRQAHQNCVRHKIPLLSSCPNCGESFRTPCYWSSGACDTCGLPFVDMAECYSQH